jgi:hypothetical protein
LFLAKKKELCEHMGEMYNSLSEKSVEERRSLLSCATGVWFERELVDAGWDFEHHQFEYAHSMYKKDKIKITKRTPTHRPSFFTPFFI